MKKLLILSSFLLLSAPFFAQSQSTYVYIASQNIEKGTRITLQNTKMQYAASPSPEDITQTQGRTVSDIIYVATVDIPAGAKITHKNTAYTKRRVGVLNKYIQKGYRLYPLAVPAEQYNDLQKASFVEIFYTDTNRQLQSLSDAVRIISRQIVDGKNIIYLEVDPRIAQYLAHIEWDESPMKVIASGPKSAATEQKMEK